MNKLIIKTAILSFVAILSLCIIAFSLISMISPITISNVCFDLGIESGYLLYTEKTYEKDKTIDNLALLTERAIYAENYKMVNKYAKLLVESAKFEGFCEFKDEQINDPYIKFSYSVYIYDNYALAAYCEQNLGQALQIAETGYINYEAYNSFSGIIDKIIRDKNKTDAQTVIAKLAEIDGQAFETEIILLGEIN